MPREIPLLRCHNRSKRSYLTGQVLPGGFQRVRHSGWLGAAAHRKWERILALLDWKAPARVPPAPLPPPHCPACGQVMLLIGPVARQPP